MTVYLCTSLRVRGGTITTVFGWETSPENAQTLFQDQTTQYLISFSAMDAWNGSQGGLFSLRTFKEARRKHVLSFHFTKHFRLPWHKWLCFCGKLPLVIWLSSSIFDGKALCCKKSSVFPASSRFLKGEEQQQLCKSSLHSRLVKTHQGIWWLDLVSL